VIALGGQRAFDDHWYIHLSYGYYMIACAHHKERLKMSKAQVEQIAATFSEEYVVANVSVQIDVRARRGAQSSLDHDIRKYGL